MRMTLVNKPSLAPSPYSHPRLFFFHAPATTEIYTLSLHDALPISARGSIGSRLTTSTPVTPTATSSFARSEEHTSELPSPYEIVCRLLLEKKITRMSAAPPHASRSWLSLTEGAADGL